MSIHVLLSHIQEVQRTHNCSALSTDIDAVSTKLEELLTCFATCHNGYNCSDATDETIDKLGLIFSIFLRKWVIIYHSNFTEQDIIKFMEVYHQNFSTYSVLPKMHLLEDHYSSMDEKMEDGSWTDGRACSRINSCTHKPTPDHLYWSDQPCGETETNIQYVLTRNHPFTNNIEAKCEKKKIRIAY